MIAVIFEVHPAENQLDPYLDMAAKMRPLAESIPGFISVERFESLTTPGKLLSLSFWEDEAALEAWRNLPQHRGAQQAGRDVMFAGYRLRVAGVIRDYGMEERAQAPADSREAHGV
ncbi:antibiotic biosynthesis monooxygenase [Lutimaribacter sp. EGI FJ00015]|uniref:Antibiotic biosynthesis monooxygenase n=1 Tax=Lutimaribacter degradans TaxID=2945989 RepID=A0ACC5ZXH9_9RHOB|nr:antibiotic biosynthesis monooxygenase [Lutimaribacter sp. EGI FJ00013]MCM2563047.1 antibiotic biosynthesis monooxygenase [Lutimaribacter sp. EGI FJ00013]MCO0614226.1 antibiotic biosynthesis monooxygenase [Lutimaribacter sp. EGI FJ00015]MCO0637036.1 antibiotic biosynthesis monooxygenase [Lutimaribacter sp. EGI FJ00014]